MSIHDPAPGIRQLMFVTHFSYLGIPLDCEMLLEPMYKIKKCIYRRV